MPEFDLLIHEDVVRYTHLCYSITVMHTTILSAFNNVCHSGFCWVITEKVLFVIVCVHAVGELRKHPTICHSPCLQMCATLLCFLGMSAAFMSFIQFFFLSFFLSLLRIHCECSCYKSEFKRKRCWHIVINKQELELYRTLSTA